MSDQCPTCAQIRATVENVRNYLDNAPGVELDRGSVEALLRAILRELDGEPAKAEETKGATP